MPTPDSEADAGPLLARLGALGDRARLRILRLLARNELSVGELADALRMPQSTLSRHLKALLEAAWILRRSEGTASLYRMEPKDLDDAARRLWDAVSSELDGAEAFAADDQRLAAVLLERRGSGTRGFFGQIGGEWDRVRQELFGRDITPEALLALLPGDWTVADLGCGTGDVAGRIAPHVSRVVAIDREPAMLEAARRRLAGFTNVDFVEGDLYDLPLRDASIDAAVVSLVFHHLADPARAMTEIARVLKPGGKLLVIDMMPHDHADFRAMGHEHLGFDRAALEAWATEAGLELATPVALPADPEAKGPALFVAGFVRRG